MVIVPIEFPGERLPPLLTVVEATVPIPPSVAPDATVTPFEEASEPLTSSVPALTVVGPP